MVGKKLNKALWWWYCGVSSRFPSFWGWMEVHWIFGWIVKDHGRDKYYGSSRFNMGVSEKRDTPKWTVYNGKPYWNGWFGGTIIFGNTHIFIVFCFFSEHITGMLKVLILHFNCISKKWIYMFNVQMERGPTTPHMGKFRNRWIEGSLSLCSGVNSAEKSNGMVVEKALLMEQIRLTSW